MAFPNASSTFVNRDETTPRAITDKQQMYLDRATRVAMKSVMTHRHGCVVVVNGDIVSEGYNRATTHMFHSFSLHSEVDALNKLKKTKHILIDAEMYVVRIASSRFDHCLKYSKPCTGCQDVINKFGVKKVYYSTNTEYERVWEREMNTKK